MAEMLRRMLKRLFPGLHRRETAKSSLDNPRTARSVKAALAVDPNAIQAGGLEGIALGTRLSENLSALKSLTGNAPDLVIRRIMVAGGVEAAVIFFDTLGRADLVSNEVIKPLTIEAAPGRKLASTAAEVEQEARARLVHTANIEDCTLLKELLAGLGEGKAALLIEGSTNALLIGLAGYESRSVEEPVSEPVVRGPREGFTESLHMNFSLIRRRIGSPLLRFEVRTIGRWTRTKVAIAYIHGLAGDSLVQEVRRRLDAIDIDGILDTSYIEEFIEDSPYTVFPQVLNTERPDIVVSNLLEGRVAILCDGSPFVLIVPTTFWALMTAGEDHYQRWDGATLIRMLRYVLVCLVVLLPSMYVAATTFHPEMLPGSMLISIAAAREAVPFSSFTEMFAMEVTFEVLREAGLRLPRPIGQTIGIVGAIIIGEAAVQAQLVSAPVVIIVAFTGVSSFVIPHYNLGIALRIVRFPILILAGTFGIFGIAMGLLLIVLHLAALRSFGQPYLSPMSPLRASDLKDSVVRLPRWAMYRRPHVTGARVSWRQEASDAAHGGFEHRKEAAENASQ